MATRKPSTPTPRKRKLVTASKPATATKPRKKQTGLQMLNEITDELSRLHEGITALSDGPGKIRLLEQLMSTYDRLIAMLREKIERHHAKTRPGGVSSTRTRRRR